MGDNMRYYYSDPLLLDSKSLTPTRNMTREVKVRAPYKDNCPWNEVYMSVSQN